LASFPKSNQVFIQRVCIVIYQVIHLPNRIEVPREPGPLDDFIALCVIADSKCRTVVTDHGVHESFDLDSDIGLGEVFRCLIAHGVYLVGLSHTKYGVGILKLEE